ncbi:hypothetical protein GCM10011402_14790 [Paracoccus acridae]|uniref:Fungal lipase-like domain-containing protein n=1 Tax=Paracoccus acridae TaxID=1795310 RepID=A0ABQ1VHW5_9RHOB|nr:hypothetical protein [Paracoccus acridae]GGF63721.1 hypothetical protein GCM10011402_14790 [Paracoccus acridae]
MTRPFRRRVFYVPGFDPMPPRRYRELYRRESRRQAQVGGFDLTVEKPAGGAAFGWQTRACFPEGMAQAQVEVLVWSDLVQASMQGGILATYARMLRTAWIYIASGALRRLMRLRRGPVLAALYPVAVLVLQLLAAVLLAMLAGWGATALTGLEWLGMGAALATGWWVLVLARSQDHRLFAHYLMQDYAFTAGLHGAYPPQLEQRLAQFADRIAQALAEDLDEVLVVGHSSGAYLAVSVLADMIRRGGPASDRPALALLTLGQVVPMASFLPRAHRLRADLAFLSERPDLFWLDVTAPGDPCSFALCDPVAVSGVARPGQRWPLVLSAAFTQTLSPRQQRDLRWRWFRLHLQYLCAFDRPGDYDYFAITAGPRRLADRFAGRHPSPGRIAIPAGPGLP